MEPLLNTLRAEVESCLAQPHSSEELNALRRELADVQEGVVNLKRKVAEAFQAQVRREAQDELLRDKSPDELQALIDAAQSRITASVDETAELNPQAFKL